jgi:membrane protease subunit HflK
MSVFDEQRPHSAPPELPPGLVRKIIIGVIILIVILFGFSMFYTVEEGQRGAILTFGKFTAESESGLHFKLPYPIQKVIILDANITQRMHIGYREGPAGSVAVPEESMMITGDENIVSADAVVEWKIADIENYLFNISDPQVFLRNAAIASIRTVMGSNKLDYAITEGKTEIQGEVRAKLVDLMVKYDTGIQIIDLKFQDIEPPEGDVQQAFRDVTNAREEKNTKINNANKYKNDRLPKARGEAQALIEQAEAQKKSRVLNAVGDVAQFNAIYNEYVKNPAVTERRLILETLEKVLPNARIFITDSAGDTVKYLPINEMLKTTPKVPVTEVPAQTPATGGAAQ